MSLPPGKFAINRARSNGREPYARTALVRSARITIGGTRRGSLRGTESETTLRRSLHRPYSPYPVAELSLPKVVLYQAELHSEAPEGRVL